MKYIVTHPKTKALLQAWAGSDELILASHFFWIAGSSLQKSQQGLLQTLLFQIISKHTEVALNLLPSRFRTPNTDAEAPLRGTYEELFNTIKPFSQNVQSCTTKMTFFIDDLDEYVGEHTDLVELISSISEGPNIKVCVSSRPWNVFTRTYYRQTDGQIEVQDLTNADINAYVRDKLNSDSLFRELRRREEFRVSELVRDITTKAEGVFLWVQLVVSSLLRGLTNDDDIWILNQRLDAYPPTLHAYFQRMFERIEGVYHRHSSRLLIATMSAERTLPFWAPKCIEIELEDPDYAFSVTTPPSRQDSSRIFGCDCLDMSFNDRLRDNALQQYQFAEFDADDEQHCCFYVLGEDSEHTAGQRKRLRTHLDARSADLLEVVSFGIGLVHRTARDFLAHGDISVQLYSRAGPDYDVGLSLARMYLLDAKRRTDSSMFFQQALHPDELAGFKNLVRPLNIPLYSSLVEELERIAEKSTS